MKRQVHRVSFRLWRIAGAWLCFAVAAHTGNAQPDSTLSADDLFSQARAKAFGGKRAEARSLLHLALKRSPGYNDIRVFLARTYAWDGFYDSARTELRTVLRAEASHREGLGALIDTELWSDRYDEAREVAERALKLYPGDEEFILKKARALKSLGRTQEAVAVLGTHQAVATTSPEILAYRKRLETELLTYSVSVNYALDFFSDVFDPMHLRYLQLGRQTSFGSLFARINSGYRFESSGFQGELDFYPSIAPGVYGYLNYGYSPSSIFPRHRFGGEIYCSLPWSLEASLGVRYLSFESGGHVSMYTGSIGWYIGNYFLSLRPYFTPDVSSTSKSATVQVRRYFGDAETYVGLKLGAGFSPDDKSIILVSGETATETYFVKSQVAGASAQIPLGERFFVNASFDVTHQELSFRYGAYVYDYSMSLGVKANL